eukprot:TRINITY_DN12998_c0_g1_i1.p1 TRINITY_DN12998_c0_g1~~TRINITY_DN12998_c0_g1_i1.p1  ORF type:complete len:466 (-),score=52.04 TRINITY_DN12998_c0_g1_i1:236-1633(-)
MTAQDLPASEPSQNSEGGLSVAVDEVPPRECGLHAACVAFCAGSVSGLTIGQAQYSFGVFVPAMASDYSAWSRVQINFALTIGMVVSSVVSPGAGYALDRFGPRIVVPLIACSCVGGWVFVCYMDSLAALYLGYALIYLAFSLNTMLQCGKVVGTWFPKSRGVVLGLVSAGNNCGGVLMVQVAVMMHWRNAALTFAILQGCVAALYAVVVRDSRAQAKAMVKDSESQAPAGQAQPPPVSLPFRTWRFLAVSFALCSCFYTYPAVLTQLFPALSADGVDDATAAGCMSLVGAFGIASKVLSGIISTKIGAKRTMQLSLLIQLASFGLLIPHGMMARGTQPPVLTWASASMYGLGFGAVGAMIPMVVLEEYGATLVGRAAGLVGFGFIVPSLVAPTIAGAVFDVNGRYTTSFVITAFVFFAALMMLEALCRTVPAVDKAVAVSKESSLPVPSVVGVREDGKDAHDQV